MNIVARVHILFFCSCLLFQNVKGQAELDSAKQVFYRNQPSGDAFIKSSFFIADQFMEYEQYDSAQIWLNKIADRLPLKKPTLFNYYLSSRQAEVYYYNGLQRLGLQESERCMQIAKALADSLLLADSYNFVGLFYMNLDSNRKSIGFFSDGLNYTRQPPYPAQYLSLTKPHHLFGNMAEAYFKLNVYDTAVQLSRKSLQFASEIQGWRGVAVSSNLLGLAFHKLNQLDSAAFYHTKGLQVAQNAGDVDVELVCYGGLGVVNAAANNKEASFLHFKNGFELLNEKPFINSLFYLRFLDDAISVYKQYQAKELLIQALQKKAELENMRIRKNDLQMNTLLNAGLTNETRLLAFEVDDAKQKQQLANTRFLFAVLALVLLSVVFFVYRYYQNQKHAAASIRQKISQDLHDDIGASLSSLQIYGTIAEQSLLTNPGKAAEMISKINKQSRDILDNMSDIVWSMKSNNTAGTPFETKIKNYVSEMLEDKDIEFSLKLQPEAEALLVSMKARRNILLIIKEVLNNAMKYSGASRIGLQVFTQDKNWILSIADDGTGFDQVLVKSGNGLKNIKDRCAELNGVCTVDSQKGTRYLFVFPIQVITNSGW